MIRSYWKQKKIFKICFANEII